MQKICFCSVFGVKKATEVEKNVAVMQSPNVWTATKGGDRHKIAGKEQRMKRKAGDERELVYKCQKQTSSDWEIRSETKR